MSVMREVLDKPTVEVNESEKGLYLSFVRWLWPVYYTSHFHVHFYMIFRYNQSEVLNSRLLKFAFFRSKEALVFCKSLEYCKGTPLTSSEVSGRSFGFRKSSSAVLLAE